MDGRHAGARCAHHRGARARARRPTAERAARSDARVLSVLRVHAGRDAIVLDCLKHGVDLETLHVDVCTTLELFKAFAAEAPGAEQTEQALQIPVYESLTPAEVERVATVVSQVAARQAAGAEAVTARG